MSRLAEAVTTSGGSQAGSLRGAGQYLDAFKEVRRGSSPVVLVLLLVAVVVLLLVVVVVAGGGSAAGKHEKWWGGENGGHGLLTVMLLGAESAALLTTKLGMLSGVGWGMGALWWGVGRGGGRPSAT